MGNLKKFWRGCQYAAYLGFLGALINDPEFHIYFGVLGVFAAVVAPACVAHADQEKMNASIEALKPPPPLC